MRALVDIPDEVIEKLNTLSREKGVSRASLIRAALSRLIDEAQTSDVDAAFGLWRGGEDGLAYQERVRSEW